METEGETQLCPKCGTVMSLEENEDVLETGNYYCQECGLYDNELEDDDY